MKKPYIIAEAGVNFYDTAKQRGVTPLEEALHYVDEAKRVGIDAIKFQTYKANTIASKNSLADAKRWFGSGANALTITFNKSLSISIIWIFGNKYNLKSKYSIILCLTH